MSGRKERHGESSMAESLERLREECDQLLRGLQKAELALIDLTLFLDTHPMDFHARRQYMLWSRHHAELKHRFVQSCGPLQWYDPKWWQKAMGFGYDPLDDCFED